MVPNVWNESLEDAGWGPQKGKSNHKFFYTYQDIAKCLNLSVKTVRSYSSRGLFDPKSLESVLYFMVDRAKN